MSSSNKGNEKVKTPEDKASKVVVPAGPATTSYLYKFLEKFWSNLNNLYLILLSVIELIFFTNS